MNWFEEQTRTGREVRTGRESGFSVIEAMIAFVVLLIITLGVLPLFSRSIVNNDAGSSYLQATNQARSRLEALRQLPFTSPDLTIPAGQTELVTEEYFSLKDKQWKAGAAPSTDPALWLRTSTIRQYSNEDRVEDNRYDDPLDGGASLDFVHIKEIQIEVRSAREGGPLGTGKRITLRHFKTF